MRLHFAEFSFDTDMRELSRDGVEIHLTPKAMQLLELLLEERPKVVSKETIYDRLWPGIFVEESNLSVLVSELRAALDDDARNPRFVKTKHGYGYSFIGIVEGDFPSRRTSLIRLRYGAREFDLLDGENIIGRDPAALVRLNHPGISRQHARIIVRGANATIEDLGSKNGTYLQGRRLDRVTALNDGDEIRLSRELLVVVKPDVLRSTVTEAGASRDHA